MIVQLLKSNLKNKRYMVILENGREVNFGDDRHQNYTMHKDEGRKQLKMAALEFADTFSEHRRYRINVLDLNNR